jgi:acyl transferase domain-containing protein
MSTIDQDAAAQYIAVVGMSGRFPGARNVDEFWWNLCRGVESITYFSRDELLAAGVEPATAADPQYVNAGGVLDDIELFDAAFFSFNARDAEILDPQQRLFLECAWESLENAGYDPETYDGMIGVFAGSAMSTYLLHLYASAHRVPYLDHFQLTVGNDKDHLPTQVSYKLNLTGPSMAIQTACSTSLVAAAVACHSLLNYQCDMALAGGVAVHTPQRRGYYYQQGGIGSPDGHCRPFDASAQGIVSGNGASVVVLKRLLDALNDGDTIRAVIRGAAINNDGSLKVGYTAPSVDGQAQVIALAQAMAGVDPETITYVEAHGTATPLGDPIEVAALTQVFQARTKRRGFCAIGSVKGNIGHLDPAAGVAGLIKTVLCLENGVIPPSLHYTQPNPKIDFKTSPFYVNAELAPWNSTGIPRRAGVSSFGIGGTNAHVVLEEAPAVEHVPSSRPHHLVVLSAKTESARDAVTDNLARYLRGHPDLDLADVAYTSQVGRRAFACRRYAVVAAGDQAGLAAALENRDPQRLVTSRHEPKSRAVAFLFPGQGVQYAGMGAGLYQTEPVFREQVDRCCELLRPCLGGDLRDVLYPSRGQEEMMQQRLRQTDTTQPALFVIEYALAQLWLHWGIVPQALVGHSIGEYVAACMAGVVSLEEALQLVAVRGSMMAQVTPGSMLAVAAPIEEVQPLLANGLSLAAHNAPSVCVLAGPHESIEQAARRLAASGVTTQFLHTSHAFHSSMMDSVTWSFLPAVQSIALAPPQIPILSNVTGAWLTDEEATDPNYWCRQLRRTVRFSDAAVELVRNKDVILLEVGPGQTLGSLVRQQPGWTADRLAIQSLPSARETKPDTEQMLQALGRLWLAGQPIQWPAVHDGERRRRIPLPTYPFERQRYWVGETEADLLEMIRQSRPGRRSIDAWFYVPTWRREPLPPTPAARLQRQVTVVFLGDRQLDTALVEQLERAERQVVQVAAGERYEQRDARAFTIRPDADEDHRALFAALKEADLAPSAVVHLWCLEATTAKLGFADCQRHGYFSVIALARNMRAGGGRSEIPLLVVGSGLKAVEQTDALNPDLATLVGAARVIRQEFPHVHCRLVDVDPEDTIDSQAVMLAAEASADCNEPVIALRRDQRWIEDWQASPLGAQPQPPALLRQRGVYLITGGLGNIGLTLAELLAEVVQARLVLTTRVPFPARDDWRAHLNQAGPRAEQVRRLLALEERGSEVAVVQADVAELGQLSAALAAAEARFGKLNGVIHGAGLTSAEALSPLVETDRAAAEQHFRPKIDGVRNLHHLLSEEPLDFVVLLSSLAAILGGIGFAPYAAANAFLDSFAQRQRQLGRQQWISINWDGWQFPTAEAVEQGEVIETIIPSEGAEAFVRVLASGYQQVAVSTSDLQRRLDAWVRMQGLEWTDATAGESGTPVQHDRPQALSTTYTPPSSDLERELIGLWEPLLGIAPIGADDDFFELGGHSLLAIQLLSRVRETFLVEVSVQDIFEATTIRTFASVVAARQEEVSEDPALAEVLAMVQDLSDEEIQVLLREER